MSTDYWGYNNTLGVEFEDRDFHDNVLAYIEKKTADGSLFFIDAKNSDHREVFYVVLEERWPHAIKEINSLTEDDFEGEDSVLAEED
jgi:hypothetical protein